MIPQLMIFLRHGSWFAPCTHPFFLESFHIPSILLTKLMEHRIIISTCTLYLHHSSALKVIIICLSLFSFYFLWSIKHSDPIGGFVSQEKFPQESINHRQSTKQTSEVSSFIPYNHGMGIRSRKGMHVIWNQLELLSAEFHAERQVRFASINF